MSTDTRRHSLHRVDEQHWQAGEFEGVSVEGAALVLADGFRRREYDDPHADGVGAVAYDEGTWTSAWLPNGVEFTSAIASWEATTPAGTWVEVSVRGRTPEGVEGAWFVMGRWCERDPEQGGAIWRTTVPGQSEGGASVSADTLELDGVTYDAVQMRVSLLRGTDAEASPVVRALSVVVSAPSGDVPATSRARSGAVELDVPPLSQQVHQGQYPQWDNGGTAWCSPTSCSMLLDFWQVGPGEEDLAWVEPMQDPQVAFAARNTYDHDYRGCGNWAFNAAYLASFGLAAYISRFESLVDAEPFLAAGVPVVVSLSFTPEQLDGAKYPTKGHLMVLIGFDEHGDPILNDPASRRIKSNDEVRIVYRRDQFEQRWLASSGGTVYIAGPRERIAELTR